MLGLRRELADRHVFDHAPPQWAHGLVGHGDAPVLSEVVETPRSQDRTPRCAIPLALTPAAVPYRASGLVHWHETDSQGWPLDVCFEGYNGSRRLPARLLILTQGGRRICPPTECFWQAAGAG